MPQNGKFELNDSNCGEFRRAAEFAGRKWNAAILMAMQLGAERYSEIRAQVDGLSGRLLTARLRELGRAGLVVRDVVPTSPVQVTYALTPAGRELIQVLHQLVGWARKWDPAQPAPAN